MKEGGVGIGDSGGLDGKKLSLLLLLLLLLLLYLLSLLFLELKYIRFSYNAFNLLCISISIVFGAFFVSVLATSFLTQHFAASCQVHVTTNQQLDFTRQKWKCLEILVLVDFANKRYF